MIKRKPKFLRIGYTQYSKLGLRRKNKQKYRKSKGIDNKIRLKMKGHLRNVAVGFRNDRSKRGLVRGLKPKIVYSIDQIKNLDKTEVGILGKIGSRKKIDIAKYLIENKTRLNNFNPTKFMEKIEEEIRLKKEMKENKTKKKEEKAKKAKEETKKKEESSLEKTEDKTEKKEHKTEEKHPKEEKHLEAKK